MKFDLHRFGPRFDEAIAHMDRLNAGDPNLETADGIAHPKELLYAQRMTARLQVFEPEASEALHLAARCQHIQRWTVPRTDFSEGKMGYRKWRNHLRLFHAEVAASILKEAGYGEKMITRVQSLIKKKGLKSDPEVQTLEDVICLVFLTHYAEAFAHKHREEKVIDILKKTWKKMSIRGHKAALALELPAQLKKLVAAALEES